MRPLLVHGVILAVLAGIGVLVLAVEGLSTRDAGWVIGRFTLARLYWLALSGYALASTFIVLSVAFVQRVRERPFSGKAVILSHAVPVGLVWILVSLGFHDLVQDVFRNAGERSGRDRHGMPGGRPGTQRAPVSSAPPQIGRQYGSSGEVVGTGRQNSE